MFMKTTPTARSKSRATSGKAENLLAAITADARQHYVAEAAYFIAKREGFPSGRELEHWLSAEAEIERLLASKAR